MKEEQKKQQALDHAVSTLSLSLLVEKFDGGVWWVECLHAAVVTSCSIGGYNSQTAHSIGLQLIQAHTRTIEGYR